MKECDNIKIHINSNFILFISLLIMFNTLLLRPSLHCNTPLHFTTLHPITLHYTSLHFTTFHYSLATLHVSSNIIAHHQEHLNCNYSFWFHSHVLLSWLSGNCLEVSSHSATKAADSKKCEWNQKLQSQLRCSCWWAIISLETCTAAKEYRNNKLSYTVASRWPLFIRIILRCTEP
jgi:hypothetical protein